MKAIALGVVVVMILMPQCFSEFCYSKPNCVGNAVQTEGPTARDCCAGTNDGQSFSTDDGLCVISQCIVHGFASALYILEEGGRLDTTFGLNMKGSTKNATLTLGGNITSTVNVLMMTDLDIVVDVITVEESTAVIHLQDEITLDYQDTIKLIFTPEFPDSVKAFEEKQGEFIRHTVTVNIIANTSAGSLCEAEIDMVWQIVWPRTLGGSTATVSCGAKTNGSAIRLCFFNGSWTLPDVTECSSQVFENTRIMVEGLLDEANIEGALRVMEDLVIATDHLETPIFPRDLNITIFVVNIALTKLELILNHAFNMTGVNIKNTTVIFEVLDNLLMDINKESYRILQRRGRGSEHVLDSIERYGHYLAHMVPVEVITMETLNGDNLVLQAESVDAGSLRNNYEFPTPGTVLPLNVTNGSEAIMKIPQAPLLARANRNDTLSMVHILFRNLQMFLPIDVMYQEPASLVISCQLVDKNELGDVLKKSGEPVIISFSFAVADNFEVTAENAHCVFWAFGDGTQRNSQGGWSDEQMQIVSVTRVENIVTVTCAGFHLTSFAVLVDVGGAHLKNKALRSVTYIGLAVSLACLLFTIIFYISHGKQLFSTVHNFVHLNLAISLFVGYLLFAVGVELAHKNTAACNTVTALIQYFFLSAFCWMMCEGVMLYLMLVVVFSTLSKKWWFFMLLGWGIPIVFVVIGLATVHNEYGVKDKSEHYEFCWLSSGNGTYAIWTFVAPMLAIITINTLFLMMVLGVIKKNRVNINKRVKEGIRVDVAMSVVKASVILLPLLGLTWVFGLFAINKNTEVFGWLFTIFNSLQGTFFFLFHVVKTARVWAVLKKSYSTYASTKAKLSNIFEVPGKSLEIESEFSNMTSVVSREMLTENGTKMEATMPQPT